ncbi:acyltransferase [Eshraghiella crossota]|uniref:Acyltransferase n=1 Tax=Eshraghiella crossota DSM 2876 TaxID=511680 RepID=D4S1Y2_9FIRM|nr:acyltransferase [Butyrivibrio crossotus]EFF67880.1 acyltransferase [Butyrivibrio crossotus DSM 2876]UWO51381.1 acyltransferase [Butyrivibrio crossotus]
MENNKKYILYFDLLNIFACFAVVALHVNGAVHTFAKTRNWVSCMFIEALFYFAVPVFFMLTGATLMNYRKRYDTGAFFKKRIFKTFVPFMIWSIIGICWSIFYTKGMKISDINTPAKFISAVINCKGMGIYWFFPALFSVYLTIPLFSLVDEDKRIEKKGIFTYLILVYIVLNVLLPFVCRLTGIQWNSALNAVSCGGYVVWFLIGYLLANTDINKKFRILIYILGLIGFFMYFYLTVQNSFKTGKFDKTYAGYMNIPAIFMGTAVFVLFKYGKWNSIEKHEKAVRFVRNLSAASFGVYLIHYYLKDFSIRHFGIDPRSTLYRIVGTFIIYGLSVIIVRVIQKIPVIRKMVP